MSDTSSSTFKRFKNAIFKKLTLMVFFILPSKISNVFISLSIITLVLKLRDLTPLNNKDLVIRINEMLKINFSEEIYTLPQQTFDWYWTIDILNSPITAGNNIYCVKQLLTDRELFYKHGNVIINFLIDKLPSAIKIKLGFYNIDKRTEFKDSIIRTLGYV